jgi:hypothetical protein
MLIELMLMVQPSQQNIHSLIKNMQTSSKMIMDLHGEYGEINSLNYLIRYPEKSYPLGWGFFYLSHKNLTQPSPIRRGLTRLSIKRSLPLIGGDLEEVFLENFYTRL